VIISQVRERAKEDLGEVSHESSWLWFIELVRRNLHIAFCFSPGAALRRCARQFPTLVNCTTIEWFQPWPLEALRDSWRRSTSARML